MRICHDYSGAHDSSRLPGQSIVADSGLPSAVLAALRAGNLGDEVRVATSTDSSDDALADIFRKHQLNTIRGPLHDVLRRYVEAAADLSDADIVNSPHCGQCHTGWRFGQGIGPSIWRFWTRISVRELRARSAAIRPRRRSLHRSRAEEGASFGHECLRPRARLPVDVPQLQI